MIEDYKILLRTGQAMPTGRYEKTRIGTMRQITEFVETYKTPSGELRKNEWYEKLHMAIIEEGETELFMKIKEHCREQCAWLHSEREIEEYSMEILAGRNYKAWKEFKR